jgi:hypothetical protein
MGRIANLRSEISKRKNRGYLAAKERKDRKEETAEAR